MNSFASVSPYELTSNPLHMIGHDWMLVTAARDGDGEKFGSDYNTMTASWGGVGVLWGKPVAFVFVRPERHTFSFTETGELMTLSFFGGERREELTYCGRNSGRDTDKTAHCALTPVFESVEGGRSVYFDEAVTVLKLRKLYADDIKPEAFSDKTPLSYYEKDGFHRMYVCEITDVLVRK